MKSDLLIPRPRRAREGHLVTFVAIALLFHAFGYLWISEHANEIFRKPGSVFHVQMLREIPPPPKPKLAPPPKPKAVSHSTPKPAPLLQIHQAQFHPTHTAPTPTEPSNLQSTMEPASGNPNGNPGGVPGGTGSIERPTPLPPPPLKPLVPNRKNPAVLNRCQPPYPELEREQGIEGTVGILVVVGRRGEIVEASITHSSGNSSLDSIAVQNVRDCWKFAPAIQNGEPVEARLTFSIVFRLQ